MLREWKDIIGGTIEEIYPARHHGSHVLLADLSFYHTLPSHPLALFGLQHSLGRLVHGAVVVTVVMSSI